MELRMKDFNIFGVHWEILFLWNEKNLGKSQN